jgi:hypothetical protein
VHPTQTRSVPTVSNLISEGLEKKGAKDED